MGRRHPYATNLAGVDREERAILLDELDGWLERVRPLSHEVPLLVEGRRDEWALRRLGVDGTILHLHVGGVSIYERCQWLDRRYAQVVLLLDWDRRGRQLRRRVLRFLEADWRTYDSIRLELERLTSPYIRHIEDLARFYEDLYITVYYDPVR